MQEILNNRLSRTILLFIIMLVMLQVTNLIFKGIIKKKRKIGMSFFRGILQGCIVIFFIFEIGGQFGRFNASIESIIKSGSLIVVLLGFILQQSLSNIVHGMVLVAFKPFEIGSRIKLVNMNITGVVTNINLNNTMIKNLATSAILIIPNAVISKEIIENFHYEEMVHKYYFDIQISYLSDIDLAIQLVKDVVAKYSIDMRSDEDKRDKVEQVEVLVQGLDVKGVNLRCPVYTEDISSNFIACSNIRLDIVKEYKKHNIQIPCG